MFNRVYQYLFLIFSHFVFLFSPSFSYSSRRETHSAIYSNLQCLTRFLNNLPTTLPNQTHFCGTKYEFFLPPDQLDFFLVSGQATDQKKFLATTF